VNAHCYLISKRAFNTTLIVDQARHGGPNQFIDHGMVDEWQETVDKQIRNAMVAFSASQVY
jgi:hypothetical protein